MIDRTQLLRNAAITGGLFAALLHALDPSPDLLRPASLAFRALMYGSLPALVWLRNRWDARWPAFAFAVSFGYCVGDVMLELIG